MTALSTVEDVKTYGGITIGTADPVLEMLLNAASDMVEKYLGYNPLTTSYDIWVNGNGSYLMQMPARPITAVSKVIVDNVNVPASSAFPNYGYTFEAKAIFLRGYTFSKGNRNINIGYVAGYANLDAVPSGIKQAVNELVVTKYKAREWLGHRSKSLAGETVSYDTSEMTKSVKGYLSDYCRVSPL